METKKCKISCDEHRTFNPNWELEYVFTEVNGKPMCLVCQKTVSVLKKANLQHHHETCHPEFNQFYPTGSNLRKDKVRNLVASFHGQQNLFCSQFKDSNVVTEASFKIAWHLAKSKKPFTDGELMKQCFLDCSKSLFAEFKNNDDIVKQISKLQVSDSTIARYMESISEDLFSQLLVWVRFHNGEKLVEEMLTLLALAGQTWGEDIYKQLMTFFEGPSKNIDLKKLVFLTIDGAPSTIGTEKGPIALLRNN
uniref:SPIN-DOC-like zinc-finger domain-containing protein n=1 Tax=Latimeria chalumnae TaxID=7897 RepID=H3AEH0_LATCH